MSTLFETLSSLTDDVIAKRKSLDDALFSLQNWLDKTYELLTEEHRTEFAQLLQAEKEPAQREGKPIGDDRSLISSVLRLHLMRLLYRYDERREGIPHSDDDSPYGRAKLRLQLALREVEMAVNEARIDATIANAHSILADNKANRRWLQDALARLQTVAGKDLVNIAKSVPVPAPPPLRLPQRLLFGIFGIKVTELGQRSINNLQTIAEMQMDQFTQMAQLLAESFEAAGDSLNAKQALALLMRSS